MGGSCYNKNLFVAFIILLALGVTNRVIIVVEAGELGTRVGFYSNTCPPAESIVRSTVEAHFRSKPSVAAGLLRLHFHDCFVRGCDASILISGPNTEQASPSNANLNGLEVIDDAKKFLEAACPGVVSCADILALAARDSVVLSGGVSWNVATGRRDGRVSKKWEPALNLAAHNDSIAAQKRKFARKGLTTKDLVTLVGGNHGFTVRQRDQIENGAHTIGTASCKLLSYSVGGANGSGPPYVNPKVVPKLRNLCPQNDPNRRVALDIDSEFKFDTSYFANLKNGEAILRSELALWTDASTRIFVQKYLAPNVFNLQFGKSMLKMANIGVKTGLRGEIRTKCNAVN